jgi:hypothetical protein
MEDKKEKIEENEIESKMDFITLSQASKITDYTAEHLNLLCRKGILKGKKIGRNWHTTKKWLAEFIDSTRVGNEKAGYKRRRTMKDSVIEETKDILSEVSVKVEEKKAKAPKIETPKIGYLERETEPRVVKQIEVIKMPPVISRLNFPKAIIQFAVMIGVSFSVFFGAAFINYIRDTQDLKKILPADLNGDTFLSFDKTGKVKAAEDIASQDDVKASVASSENFQLKEISFGGVPIASANNENLSPEITDVKSQNFLSKDGNAEILITWKTNKMTVSEIQYSRKEIDNPKSLDEKYYGFNHSAVLTGLELGSSYVYQVNCKDQWGNSVSSDKFGLYTGTKVLSVFDLIVKALNETFGWAMKK